MNNSYYHCMFCRSNFEVMPDGGKCPICSFPINNNRVIIDKDNGCEAFLVKIGSEIALKNMRDGNFWLQAPRYFQENFENEARDDIFDSAFDYVELDSGIPVGNENCKIATNQNMYRILCFGYISVRNGIIEVPDERMKLFGTHFSYVSARRLQTAFETLAKEKQVDASFGEVHYLGDTYKGIYTPFCKLPKFTYQNEKRLVFISEEYTKWNELQRDEVHLGNISSWFSKPVPVDVLYQRLHMKEFTEVILD